MTNSPEHGPSSNDSARGPKTPIDTPNDQSDKSYDPVDSLIQATGFYETVDSIEGAKQALEATKQNIFDALQHNVDPATAWQAYFDRLGNITIKLADELITPEAAAKFQLGSNLYTALIYGDTNQTDKYRLALIDVQMQAHNNGLTDIADHLQTEIETLIDASEPTAGYLIGIFEPRLSPSHFYDLIDLADNGGSLDDIKLLAYRLMQVEDENPETIFDELGLTLPTNLTD